MPKEKAAAFTDDLEYIFGTYEGKSAWFSGEMKREQPCQGSHYKSGKNRLDSG